MPDIDRIIEQLLGDRRIRESATFSSRAFSDQPLIERGSDLKQRMEQRRAERAEQSTRRAEERAQRRKQEAKRTSKRTPASSRQSATVRPKPSPDTLVIPGLDSLLGPAPQFFPREKLPARIAEMRELEDKKLHPELAEGPNPMGKLFYHQARLMEDFEDEYEFKGWCRREPAVYAELSDRELRGYFSWRTSVRRGDVRRAPNTFIYLYLSELSMSIGAEPGPEGLKAIEGFRQAYSENDWHAYRALYAIFASIEQSYAIYHDVPNASASLIDQRVNSAALTLLKEEHELLRERGGEPKTPHPVIPGMDRPSQKQVFASLGTAGRYHIDQSRLAKDEPDLLARCAHDAFAALVEHCNKRRKTDFVEGIFGYARMAPTKLFSHIVFYEENPHPDCQIQREYNAAYLCRDGRWTRVTFFDGTMYPSKDIGLAMHCVDYELREQLGYAYPLKERSAPKYVKKIAHDVVAARLEERAEAERRRITIDRSKLGSIRAAAAVTQEALLTDEEREPDEVAYGIGEAQAAPSPAFDAAAHVAAEDQQLVTSRELRPGNEPSPKAAATASLAITPATGEEGPATGQGNELLSPVEQRFILGLMQGEPVAALLGPTDPFASVVADSINEKLFDAIGDAVIEFDGDEPHIIEDYLDDIREVISL